MRLPGGRTWIGEILMAPISVVAWLISGLWLTLIVILSLPLLLFMPFQRFQVFFHPWTGWTTLTTCSPMRVFVDPDYRKDRVSMFTQNHVSMLDGCIACGAIRVPLCGLEHAAHLHVPGYGWLMRMANAIPVDRKKKGWRQQIAKTIRERAERGINVLVFPEGTRTLDGHVREFKSGVFRMAIDSGIPIVPIAVRGAFKSLPKGVFTFRPSLIEVYIAPQIETEGLSPSQIPALIERTRTIIEAWVERGERLGDLCSEPFDPPKLSAAE